MLMPAPLQQVDRTYVLYNGRRLSYFAGCDYFRMASHPAVLKALQTGVKKYGLNVSASRVTTGNHPIYESLEKRLAHFFDVESATLASSGYAPNLMVAQALAGQFSHALIDERAHGCLVDAAQLLACPIVSFKHRDADDLARVVRRLGPIDPLLLTDGMFSHDGGIAPIKQYLAALPASARILLDDAHGVGVLGKRGRGTLEHEHVSSNRIIQTITLSKAFGVYGGAVLGSNTLKTAIVARSRFFIGNTPLPPPLAAAALKSLETFKNDSRLRVRLNRNTASVKTRLRANGFDLPVSPAPIIPLIPKDSRESHGLRRRLLAAGIHPPLIRYPGSPETGYFRFVISSEHTDAQLNALTAALLSWKTNSTR